MAQLLQSVSTGFRGPDLHHDNLGPYYWKQEIQDCIDDGFTDLDQIKKQLLRHKPSDTDVQAELQWKSYEKDIEFMYFELEKEQNQPLRITEPRIQKQNSVRDISDVLKIQDLEDENKKQNKYDDSIAELISEVQNKMKSVLQINTETTDQNEEKLAEDNKMKDNDYLEKESHPDNTEDCVIKENHIKCEPLKRIEVLLFAYNKLIKNMDTLQWNKVSMTQMIQIDKIYEHQQLFNDFCHIKAHIDRDNELIRSRDHEDAREHIDTDNYTNAANILCTYFENKLEFKCGKIGECRAFERHYRDRMNEPIDLYYKSKESKENRINADIVFQQECDKIHAYFFHSTIKFGIRSYQTTIQQEQEIDRINKETKGTRRSKGESLSDEDEKEDDTKSKNTEEKSFTMTYIGRKLDDKWWKDVEPNKESTQSADQVYNILVKNIGTFRWQNAHGFKESQYQGIMHNRKKFGNIKEEVLDNDYKDSRLSKDSWNQTLRKAHIFWKSWAGRSIKTKYDSFFDDKVAGHYEIWKKGTPISLLEIITLKLYTDFDKLQSELKKCFRYESVADILIKNKQETDDTTEKENEQKEKEQREDLENRLANFYHWRGGLLIVLNKFCTKINHKNNIALYHGVNAKMLIRASQKYAFYGPLSTTSSYHVARTFATAKGMVLKITSHFPRLSYCNALDCSLLSDYPEEQEWLVGFMYVRVLQVRTRKLTDPNADCEVFLKTIPMSSFIRMLFFTIHLFNEQIFSMSDHLERWLKQFLKVNRMECCCPFQIKECKNEGEEKHCKDFEMEKSTIFVCAKGAQHKAGIQKLDEMNHPTISEDKKEDMDRKMRIFPILWQKFRQFAENPNLKQRVKFDVISDHLRRFFMEETEYGNKEWRISFKNITTVYPKIKEIHFINEHIFDDIVLQRLIDQIKGKNEDIKRDINIDKYPNTIEKIVFLYYNYKDDDKDGKPLNFTNFKDPDTLNETLKNELNSKEWAIKSGKNGLTGYKIRIYKESNK